MTGIMECFPHGLRYELDYGCRHGYEREDGSLMTGETLAIEWFEGEMEAMGECTCNDRLGNIFPECTFRITREQYENGEMGCDDLWDHFYSHIGKQGKRKVNI